MEERGGQQQKKEKKTKEKPKKENTVSSQENTKNPTANGKGRRTAASLCGSPTACGLCA